MFSMTTTQELKILQKQWRAVSNEHPLKKHYLKAIKHELSLRK